MLYSPIAPEEGTVAAVATGSPLRNASQHSKFVFSSTVESKTSANQCGGTRKQREPMARKAARSCSELRRRISSSGSTRVGGRRAEATMPGSSAAIRRPNVEHCLERRRRADHESQSSQTQRDHARRSILKCSLAMARRSVSSPVPSIALEKKAALNIWKRTPREAIVTPESSGILPPGRTAAKARKDCLRFSSTG